MDAHERVLRRLAAAQISRRRALGLAAGGAAATGLLAACGARNTSSTKPATSANAPSGKPKPGGELNLAQKFNPNTFDSSTRLDIVAEVFNFTCDTLAAFKVGPNVKYADLTLVPSLAAKWESPDAQTFTFHLQPGVKFADLPPVNGRVMSSADVKWTFEYLARLGQFKSLPKDPVGSMFEGLVSVETPDASTTVLHFKAPFVPFLSYAALPWLSILPHEVYDKDGDFSKRVVGTGPWQLDMSSSQVGQRWVYKKNPTYFQAGRPYIDQINWLIVPDDTAVDAAFQTKQVDMLNYSGLELQTVDRMQKAIPGVVRYDYPNAAGNLLYLNVTKPPFNDQRIRKALSLSIDHNQFLKTLSEGKGEWALAGSMPDLFTQAETEQILQHDPAQAKQLVSQAGFPDGVAAEAIYPGLKYGQAHVTMLQLLQAQIKPAGINLTLKSLDAATESNRKRNGDFELDLTPKSFRGDLDYILFGTFYSKSKGNYGRIKDPKLDKMLLTQRQEVDPAKRKQLFRQTVKYINEEPWSQELFYATTSILWQPYLKNYSLSLGYPYPQLRNSWLEK